MTGSDMIIRGDVLHKSLGYGDWPRPDQHDRWSGKESISRKSIEEIKDAYRRAVENNRNHIPDETDFAIGYMMAKRRK